MHMYQLVYNLKVNKMIKVVIFCCKLCGFFRILALFDDLRVQKMGGQNSNSSSPTTCQPPPPLPLPTKKGMLDTVCVTRDQALFSFRFENDIPSGNLVVAIRENV